MLRLRRFVLSIPVCASVLLLAAPLASAAPGAVRSGSFAGIVTTSTGTPLRHVTVSAVHASAAGEALLTVLATTTTRADGTYLLSGIRPDDDVMIQFSPVGATGGSSRAGYADRCHGGAPWCTQGGRHFVVGAGSVFTGVDAALPEAGRIVGRVTDSLERGVGGVFVSVYAGRADQSSGSLARPVTFVRSDPNGKFAVPRLAAWSYAVCFGEASRVVPATPAPDGYVDRCYDGDAQRVSVSNGATVHRNTRLTGAGAVTGTVVDEAGAPVPGAAISLAQPGLPRPAVTATGDDGTFALRAVVPGTNLAFCATTTTLPHLSSCSDDPASTPITVRQLRTTQTHVVVHAIR